MPATRRRRIVRRAVIAVGLMALLPVGYVSGYLSLQWLEGRQFIGFHEARRLRRDVFRPLCIYERWGLPYAQSGPLGCEVFSDFALWCRWRGEGSDWTWIDLHNARNRERALHREFDDFDEFSWYPSAQYQEVKGGDAVNVATIIAIALSALLAVQLLRGAAGRPLCWLDKSNADDFVRLRSDPLRFWLVIAYKAGVVCVLWLLIAYT